MLASEAITLMSSAELKQFGLKSDQTAVLGFINRGILELHKRFILWQDEAIVTLALDVLQYKFDGIDANVTIDLSDKRFLRVDAVYDEDGVDLNLNDELDPYAVTTPRWNIIEVPAVTIEEVGTEFGVVFRASPIALPDVNAEMDLPPQLEEALFLYCAYLAALSVDSDDKSEIDAYYKRYDNSLDRVDFRNLIPSESMETNKWTDRGFV